MDQTKAQRLLNKIQAFLDNGNGHELSRLEKDLIKSYVQQLYDAVTSEEIANSDQHKPADSFSPKSYKSDDLYKSDSSSSKTEETPPKVIDIPKAETAKPFYSDYIAPEEKPKTQVFSDYKPPVEKSEPPLYTDYTPPVHKAETPRYNQPQIPVAKKQPEESDQRISDKESTPSYAEEKTVESSFTAPVKETSHSVKENVSPGDQHDTLLKLFDLQKSDEMGHRFGHVPIPSIESAMGLNERIFTLNELFGGDKALFDAWCAKLNSLSSFNEAKGVLMAGPAKDFKWAEPQRLKMAEQFIRIVSRRYPKSVS